jgi:hypothetical protein
MSGIARAVSAHGVARFSRPVRTGIGYTTMVRGKPNDSGRRGDSGTTKRRASESTRGPALDSRLRDAVASLDAEDIAMARLQAQVRRTETIQAPARPTASRARRTTVQLSDALLARLRDRARRDGATASAIVERALERFLRSR